MTTINILGHLIKSTWAMSADATTRFIVLIACFRNKSPLIQVKLELRKWSAKDLQLTETLFTHNLKRWHTQTWTHCYSTFRILSQFLMNARITVYWIRRTDPKDSTILLYLWLTLASLLDGTGSKTARVSNFDHLSWNVLRHSQDLFSNSPYCVLWFLGFQMADRCVKLFHCGTHATGWLKNGHPTQSEGAVAREVCFHWRDDCCYFRQQIMVRRCEHFYIYKFPRMDISYLRYCGKGSVMDNHWLTH